MDDYGIWERSQTRIVPSLPAEASKRELLLNASSNTMPFWPLNRPTSPPFFTSQTRTMLSSGAPDYSIPIGRKCNAAEKRIRGRLTECLHQLPCPQPPKPNDTVCSADADRRAVGRERHAPNRVLRRTDLIRVLKSGRLPEFDDAFCTP